MLRFHIEVFYVMTPCTLVDITQKVEIHVENSVFFNKDVFRILAKVMFIYISSFVINPEF